MPSESLNKDADESPALDSTQLVKRPKLKPKIHIKSTSALTSDPSDPSNPSMPMNSLDPSYHSIAEEVHDTRPPRNLLGLALKRRALLPPLPKLQVRNTAEMSQGP
jgi:hypothetical protein